MIAKKIKRLLMLSVLINTHLSHAEELELQDNWWNGFSITPAVGFRHLGFMVKSRQNGDEGNISNEGFAQTVAVLNIATPSINLTRSGNVKLELQSYTALLKLDHQFYKDGGTLSTGGDSGERVDVGTRVDGYYSYLLPAIRVDTGGEENRISFSLGVGYWISNFSGDIILSPGNRPSSGMPKTDIKISSKELGYLFTMSWAFGNDWTVFMSVGGARFDDDLYKYEAEEVSIMLGHRFVL